MKPGPFLWQHPAGQRWQEQVSEPPRTVQVYATLELPIRRWIETRHDTGPQHLLSTARVTYTLADELPGIVTDLQHCPIDLSHHHIVIGLRVEEDSVWFIRQDEGQVFPDRKRLAGKAVLRALAEALQDGMPAEAAATFAGNPTVTRELRAGAREVIAAHVEGLGGELQRASWLREVSASGMVPGWVPEALPAGPAGFLEAVDAMLQKLPGPQVAKLLDDLSVPCTFIKHE